MARQKVGRQGPAAYAASQPLFEALKNACDEIPLQETNLTKARDTVQQLHVKLDVDDAEKHQLYIDSAIRAWRSATQTYTAIFHELAAVTAADKSEGKEAAAHHATFKAIAETARLAQRASNEFATQEDLRRKLAEEESSSSETSSTSGVETVMVLNGNGKRTLSTGVSPEQPNKMHKLSRDAGPATKGETTAQEKAAAAPQAPFGTLGASEKKAWKAEQRKKKIAKKKAKRRDLVNAGGESFHVAPGSAKTADPVLQQSRVQDPHIEYDDVSAEVEKRLQEKELLRKAKKEAKKRKRESVESLPSVSHAEERDKKKAKAVDSKAMGMNDAEQAPPKRKMEGDATTVDVAVRAKKKKSSRKG